MKRTLILSLAIVLALSLVIWPVPAKPALANTVFNVPDDYGSIQGAIDATPPAGGTVKVAAGTYDENIIITERPKVKILGAGADVTTIIGDGRTSVVTGNNMHADSRIEGFTITSGGQTPVPDFGGGINLENSATTIASCNITGNSAIYGGGIYISDQLNQGLSPQVINCLIKNNSASQWGGGIFFFGSALSPMVMNCTIADNSAGDGVYNLSASSTIINTIIYGNSANNIPSGDTSTATYSCIGVTTPDPYPGAGNINDDPLFDTPSYKLKNNPPDEISPCIDTGTDAGAPSDDLDGVSRPQGDGYDMGAYEFHEALPPDEPPQITDTSPSAGTTGDSYTFIAAVDDDITPANQLTASVSWQHGSLSGDDPMAYDAINDVFSATITLDHSTSTMNYTITAEDTGSNSSSASGTVQVTDNDAPEIADNSPSSGTGGEDYAFIAEVIDNTDDSADLTVTVSWIHGSLSETDETMTYNSGTGYFERSIILDTVTDDLTYTIAAEDTAGNGISIDGSATVTYNQSPLADAGSDEEYTLELGQSTEEVTLDGSGSYDPDGTIKDYNWTAETSGSPDPPDEVSPTLDLGAGVHTFSLVVTDNDDAVSEPDYVTITVNEASTPPVDSAYDIKSDTVDKLESAKGENRSINRRIDRIIRCINASLNDKYWEDNISRLDARLGKRVFQKELAAAALLEAQIRTSERTIPTLERFIAWKQSKGRPTDEIEAKLAALQAALPVFQEVLDALAQADKILAEVAIEDAKSTPVQNPRFERIYNRFIAKAEQSMARASQLLNDGRPSKAILYFKKAWQYAQIASNFAGRS